MGKILSEFGSLLSTVGADLQAATLPTAGADFLGKIVQYIVTTNSNYTNGYFYKCVYDGTSYSWEEVNVQDGGDDITVTGNPLTFETSSEGVASKTIITLEPIQAGSGYPSPSNVRRIEGYDRIIVAHQANFIDFSDITTGYYLDADGNEVQNAGWNISNYIALDDSTLICYLMNGGSAPRGCWYDSNKTFLSSFSQTDGWQVLNKPSGASYLRLSLWDIYSSIVYKDDPTDLSIAMPGTIYGGTLDVESGELVINKKIVNAKDLTWIAYSYGYEASVAGSKLYSSCKSSHYVGKNITSWSELSDGECGFAGAVRAMRIVDASHQTDISTWNTYIANNNIKICYELDTPITYQLTPYQVQLLLGDNTVSTNGTSIQMTYNSGTVATQTDLVGIAKSVNGLSEEINDISGKSGDQYLVLSAISIAPNTARWLYGLSGTYKKYDVVKVTKVLDNSDCTSDFTISRADEKFALYSWIAKDAGELYYVTLQIK